MGPTIPGLGMADQDHDISVAHLHLSNLNIVDLPPSRPVMATMGAAGQGLPTTSLDIVDVALDCLPLGPVLAHSSNALSPSDVVAAHSTLLATLTATKVVMAATRERDRVAAFS